MNILLINKKQVRIFLLSVLFSGILMFGYVHQVAAQTQDIILPDETKVTELPSQFANLFYYLPVLVLGLMVLMIIISSVVILIKTLNPMAGESEENFSKGKKWFQGTGVLLIAPLIMIIAITFVWVTLGFGNPLDYLKKDPQEIASPYTDQLDDWYIQGGGTSL